MMSLHVLLLLLLSSLIPATVTIVTINTAAKDCLQKYRSKCAQSTFQIQEGTLWACPFGWKRASFTSTRHDDSVRAINTTNLTAQIDQSNNQTSIKLCSFTPTGKDSKMEWPGGGYCVPSPADGPCPGTMVNHTATITAPGRSFNCTPDSPMFNCTRDSFEIHACCPANTSSARSYLDVPMYNITFYLLKTGPSCPLLLSHLSTEESIELDRASAAPSAGSAGLGHFTSEQAGNLTLHFCRYTPVFCPRRVIVQPYESMIQTNCGRYSTVWCNWNNTYPKQPENDTAHNYFDEYCYPNETYHSNHFCGARCPMLPAITDGTLSTLSNATYTRVEVRCKDGFYVTGNSTTRCQRNGTWSRDISATNCTFVKCDPRDLITAPGRTGRVPHPDGTANQYAFGHNVTFTCKDYTKKCMHFEDDAGSKVATCLSSGNWSEIPRCLVGKNCANPLDTATATRDSQSAELRCHSVLNYTCIPHHTTRHPADLAISCLPNGTWTHAPPTCDIVFCDTPALDIQYGEVFSPQHTDLRNATFVVNDTVKYSCDNGYAVAGHGPELWVTCGAAAAWNASVANVTCERVVCPLPGNISHGHREDLPPINKTHFFVGDQVEYACDTDMYELHCNDTADCHTVECNSSGMWQPGIPSCDLVTCEGPSPAAHSVAPPGPFPLNSTYPYTCEPGYSRKTLGVLTCTFNRNTNKTQWVGDPPQCNPVYCSGILPALTHGTYTSDPQQPTYGYNTRFSYTCDEGYNSSVVAVQRADPTSSVVTMVTVYYFTNCSQNATWIPPPACNQVQCRKPGIAYTVVNVSKALYDYNDVISIECHENRHYVPPQALTCREKGAWKVNSGEPFISCHGPPVTDPPVPITDADKKKWTFIGVGLGMFVLLLTLLLVLVTKRRRRDQEQRHHKFVSNPSYKPGDNELTGLGRTNPTYEDSEPHSFSINKNTSSRLVLQDVAGYSLPKTTHRIPSSSHSDRSEVGNQYDTLHKARQNKLNSVYEPEEGTYNTLSKTMPNTASKVAAVASGEIHSEPLAGSSLQIRHNPLADAPDDDDEDIYNVPTLGRNPQPMIRVTDSEFHVNTLPRDKQELHEINDLYSSRAAAQICGSPAETDFDSIIYDNI